MISNQSGARRTGESNLVRCFLPNFHFTGQTTGTGLDRASRGREEEEAEVDITSRGRGEDGRREAGGETGLLHRTGGASGVGLVIRATTHHMVTVSTHPEEGGGGTITHPGVGGEISGEEGESIPQGEEEEVVEEVVTLPPLLGRVKATSALKCCKTPGRICRPRWAGQRATFRQLS